MVQSVDAQNFQMNERFDRLLKQNGQNKNQVVLNEVPAVGLQLET